MKNKKLFAILTLVCFMFTLMPVAAFAATADYQESFVLTAQNNPTIKEGKSTGIVFDFSKGTTTSDVYVWFVKDGANVPANAVEKDTTAATASDISVVGASIGSSTLGNVFKIVAADEAKTYKFQFNTAGEYKVYASLDQPTDDKSLATAIASVNEPLQVIAAQNVITVTAVNTNTADYTMTDVNSVLTHQTSGNVYSDNEVGTLAAFMANTATVKTIKLAVKDINDDAVKYEEVTIKADSSNVIVSKEKATTNALGQFSFDVSAEREGDYKVYVSIGQYEMVIKVNATATQAVAIELESAPKAPLSLDGSYTADGLKGEVVFRIYDAAGSEVTNAALGVVGATATATDDNKNFVALTEKPSASSLKSENFRLVYVDTNNGWTIKPDANFDEEGTYSFRVVLDNGAYATASVTVKEMGTPVAIKITFPADAIELASYMQAKNIVWVDANGVTEAVDNSVDIAVSGYAVENVYTTGVVNALTASVSKPVIEVKDNEKYVGSKITVTVVDERNDLIATTTLTVANEATDLAFDKTTAEVDVNNKIKVQVVDQDGNTVAPNYAGIGEAKVVVLDKPENAKVSVSTSNLDANKGTFDMNLTSDTVGNVTVQAVLKITQNNVNKYYTGIATINVGGAEAGNVVVMSIGSSQMVVNNKVVEVPAPAVIKDSRTFVPFRAIGEAFGAEVVWDAATQSVTAELNGVTVVLTIGSNVYTVNGVEKTADVAPYIAGEGYTMVPARFIAEAFGYDPIFTTDENGAVADVLFL